MNFDARNEAYMAFMELVETDFNTVSLKQKEKYEVHMQILKSQKSMRDLATFGDVVTKV